ncbi:radical SAM protein [Edwardsiella tarda]|uniref:radical SAM protein n=1 Tax=Edwardsiella tarda TaxID=636 RepID=UPI00351C59B2
MINSKNIFLNLTTRCNLKCAKCWRSQSWGKGDDISPLVLSKFKDVFHNFSGNVIIGSGENLIAKYLDEYILWAVNNNIKTTILTTGLKFDKFFLQANYFNPIIKWGVTLDGFRQEQVKDIQKGMIIERVKKNLFEIKSRYPKSNFYLNVTHTRKNLIDTSSFVELANSLKINELYFTQLKLFDGLDDSKTKNLVNNIDDPLFIMEINKAKKLSEQYGIKLYAPLSQKTRLCFNKERKQSFSPIIDINGDISFCYGRNDITVGNLITNPDGWRSHLDYLNSEEANQNNWCSQCHACKKNDDGYFFISKKINN